MSRFIESIRILNGRRMHLTYHNIRANLARKTVKQTSSQIDFSKIIRVPSNCQNGLYKCRIVYAAKIEEISFLPYQYKEINSLQVVQTTFDYPHKYEDRCCLDLLYQQRNENDDILIIKNGMVTDTYYCNVAFLLHGLWYTPAIPLLPGTMRAYLLDKKRLTKANIAIKDIMQYEKICLFNAMIPFGKIVLDTVCINH